MLTVATAIRSAGTHLLGDIFVGRVDARCTSSGCIELVSNSRTISRRPATSCGGHWLRWTGAVTCRPSAPRLRRAARSSPSASLPVSEISWKERPRTSWGWPSSRTSKSAAVSPLHDVAGAIANHDVDRDEVASAAEGRALLLLLGERRCVRARLRQPRRTDSDALCAFIWRPCTVMTSCAALRAAVRSACQNRNRSPSCMERIGRTERTWPNVGELTTVSMAAVVDHVQQVGRVQVDARAHACGRAGCHVRTARRAGGCPGR